MANADLQILLKLKDEASKELGQAKSAIGGLEKAAIGAGLALAGGLAAGLASSISKAAEFEKEISAIKAVTGATAEEAKQLGAVALQLGKDTSFSATEAAKGIGELAKGGVEVADIMGGAAKSALDLAAAGGVSVADAAALAANAMALFKIEGKDTAQVVDQIAGFANATTGSVSDFKFALQAVGAVAVLAGQDFDQTATALGVLGKAGMLGSDAGTSLKAMLNNLIPTTEKASEMFTTLGLRTKDVDNAFLNADGSFKDLRDIAGELNRVTKDLTESERSLALETIFGSDAIRAAAILAEAGADGFDAMAEAMSKVSAEAVAAERLNNLSGVMEQLKGSIETAQIQLGTAFLPVLKEAATALLGFVNTAVIPFVEEQAPKWAESIKNVTEAFKGMAEDGGLGGLLKEMARDDLPQTISLLEKLSGTVLGDAIKKLGELKNAYKEAQKSQDETKKATGVLTAAFPLHVQALETGTKSANELSEAFNLLGTKTTELKDAIGPAWEGIKEAVGSASDALGTKVKEGQDAIQTKITEVQDAIKAKIKEIWDAIPEDIRADLELIATAVGEKFDKMGTDIQAKMTEIREGISTAWTAITTAVGDKLGEIGEAIGTKFGEFLSAVTTKSGEIGEEAVAPWKQLADAIGPHLSAALSAVTGFAGGVMSALGSLASEALSGARAIGDAIISGIRDGIAAGVQSIRDAAGNAARAALAAAKAALGVPGPEPQYGPPVPQYQHGGIVPGPVGAARLAIVHGGERITPAGDSGHMSNGTTAGGPTYNFYGPVFGDREFWAKVEQGIVGGHIHHVPGGF